MLEVLADYRITNVSAAATHYRMMKNCGAAGGRRFHVEKLSFTGEPIDSDTAEFVERTFGRAARSMYGTTEVGVILGGYPGAADLPMRRGSLGKPMPGVEVAIRDADGAVSAAGAAGEIVVRRGDGWFPTRDLGRVDEDGWFYHAGRADDVIISAGWTMSAVEIEDALLRHPDVDEIAVIGVPDELRGQVVKAFVVSERRPDDGGFEAELQAFARERLGRHEYPRRVELVAELPKTPAGKVNRMALREREAALAGSGGRTDRAGAMVVPSPGTTVVRDGRANRFRPEVRRHDGRRRRRPVSPDHRRGARRAPAADRSPDPGLSRALVPRGDPRQHPALRARHRRRQPALVRSGLRPHHRLRRRDRAPVLPLRVQPDHLRLRGGGSPACTRCGRGRTGAGTGWCPGTRRSIPRRGSRTSSCTRPVSRAGRCSRSTTSTSTTARGTFFAGRRSWCFRTERDTAREQGTKYDGVRRRGERRCTPEELDEVFRRYAAERARGAEPRRFADVKIGDSLPPMLKGPMTVTGFICYAQGWGGLYIRANRLAWRQIARHSGLGIANRFGIPDCPERVHWEDEFAVEVGAPGAYDYGPERCSWMIHHLTDWMGDDGFVESSHCEIRRHNPVGDTLHLEAKVTEKTPAGDGAGGTVRIEQRAHNQDGELSVRATATVRLPA